MRTRPGHPLCNGQVEHFNWTVVSMIKSYLKGRQRDWDRKLCALRGTYCVTSHDSTRMTANLPMPGRETLLPIEVILGSWGTYTGEPVSSYGKYIDGLRDQRQRMHNVARKYLGRNVMRMKESHNVKCSLTHYKPGDLVMYAAESGELDVAPMLRVNFQGLYLVLDTLGDLDYWVQLDARGKQKVRHHDKLKPQVRNQALPWVKSALRAHKTKAKWSSPAWRT